MFCIQCGVFFTISCFLLFPQILKYGAQIVDALRNYKQPIFVYIPPLGELRGGAWVVVDPTINEDCMEMFAETTSRGGVLEPEGTVEIKFRERDLLKSMRRLDPECISLSDKLASPDLDQMTRCSLERKLKERHRLLIPIYHQVAVTFADLHDRAQRMLDKGVIADIVDWRTARAFFCWRLRRRLNERRFTRAVRDVDASFTSSRCLVMLRRWFIEEQGLDKGYLWDNDEAVNEWLNRELTKMDEKNGLLHDNLMCLRRDKVLQDVRE